jgi:hypothetical protein
MPLQIVQALVAQIVVTKTKNLLGLVDPAAPHSTYCRGQQAATINKTSPPEVLP